jgi:protein KRI1
MPPLLSLWDSDSETPSQCFKINESYAARLEYNKTREELHRLEAKYGKLPEKQDDPEDSSTSESKDEAGDLVTPELDAEIWWSIAAIREHRPECQDRVRESKGLGEREQSLW